MFRYVRESIHAKILIVIIALMSVGVIASITYELRVKERELLDDKLRASEFMAKPVLDVIYEDMIGQRADLARRLLKTLGGVEGVDIRIIRNNGVEEAFRDLKTIDKVRKKYGSVRQEWLTGHEDKKTNVASGTDSPKFRKAFADFKKNWNMGPIYYREKRNGHPVFTYLQPIESRPACGACHTGSGARGIIMITTPLDGMYATLAGNRRLWFIVGILSVFFGGVIISILVKKMITGPLRAKMSIIKRIADGDAGISERLEVRSMDEMGYLADAFNKMLNRLERRAEENRILFSSVEKGKAEWMATFDSIHDLISIHDKDDRIIRVNTALASKCGKTPAELIGKTCEELFYGGVGHADSCPHGRTISTGSVMDVEVDTLVIKGTYKITTFPVKNESGEIKTVVHVARDISMEKSLGEKLLHAEKLSSMGKLVAGIAHELNNPLMGIMGFSQLLMDTPDDKRIKDVRGKLEKIYNESMRTARIVQNLLTFARATASEREYRDINALIESTIDLRGYSLRSNNIEISLEFDKTLPPIMVDKYQTQQVFINIINNAEDAMLEARGRGTLKIKTAVIDGQVEITFTDDGPGVPLEIIGKVFDPFFTTKDVGRGTGLGLSITHGIVAEHGGSIIMENNPAGGAMVRISLPVEDGEKGAGMAEDVAYGPGIGKRLEGQTILLVEDEPAIRESLSIFLMGEGLVVDAVSDGAEALRAMEAKEYALIVSDLKMAGINGVELYKATVLKRPWLAERFIMLTGDVFSEEAKAFLEKHSCPCLLKPFEPPRLLEAINRLFNV